MAKYCGILVYYNSGGEDFLDKECRALIFEGRTYVQPQFTGEVIGVVVRCTPTETGWDLLLLQEEFHRICSA